MPLKCVNESKEEHYHSPQLVLAQVAVNSSYSPKVPFTSENEHKLFVPTGESQVPKPPNIDWDNRRT